MWILILLANKNPQEDAQDTPLLMWVMQPYNSLVLINFDGMKDYKSLVMYKSAHRVLKPGALQSCVVNTADSAVRWPLSERCVGGINKAVRNPVPWHKINRVSFLKM